MSDRLPIYLDNNATTPIHPEVVEKIQKSLHQDWANPSSSYDRGLKVRNEILKARKSVSQMIGGPLSDDMVNESITFTSGGTESNHLVINSAIDCFKKACIRENGSIKKPHIVTTNIEHVAIENPLKAYENEGKIHVTYVEVEDGRATEKDILEAIRENTCLVTIMMANNETGIINPIGDIMRRVKVLNKNRKFPILTHTDAAQAIGKISVDVKDLFVDYLTIVGHKFYGPRIGALYHNAKLGSISPYFLGGNQEFGRRAGTENTPMIVGLGKASELISTKNGSISYTQHQLELRIQLENGLRDNLGSSNVHINFESQERLPNTCSVSFPHVDSGRELLNCLSGLVDASTSAACHSASVCGSGILTKSGLDPELARRTVRLSVGKFTTKKDIDIAVRNIVEAVKSFHK
ncbi:selenocysteine lyase [Lepeophtheirus salmonis]|uniref:selenocysteine lyase n=1 Tax=Lepeophtheirus salmonis TaxID=72036 RepID=UPI001AE68DEE|nr:selenocysteine lyase-like [Lepeophtheirus salmonis]